MSTLRPKEFDYKTHYIELFRAIEKYFQASTEEAWNDVYEIYSKQTEDIKKQIDVYSKSNAIKNQSSLIEINHIEFKAPYRLIDLLTALYQHKLLKIVAVKSIPPLLESIDDDSLEKEWMKIISVHLVMAGIAQSHPTNPEFIKCLKINKWTLGLLLDNLIETWHSLEDELLSQVELNEFLGLTWDEYKEFSINPNKFFEEIIKEIKGQSTPSKESY